MCEIKKGNLAPHVAVLILGVVSNDKVITPTDNIRSKIMNLCESLLAIPAPMHHFHNSIAMLEAYDKRERMG